jgi:hypothetical protein
MRLSQLLITIILTWAVPIVPIQAEELIINNYSTNKTLGIFDPSITYAPESAIWLSYSYVLADNIFGAKARSIGTKLAVSYDQGKTFSYKTTINTPIDQPLPWPYQKLKAKWNF